jgi:hypothetical protein
MGSLTVNILEDSDHATIDDVVLPPAVEAMEHGAAEAWGPMQVQITKLFARNHTSCAIWYEDLCRICIIGLGVRSCQASD